MASLLGLDSVVKSVVGDGSFKLSFGGFKACGMAISKVAFGVLPNMFNRIIVGSIGWHRDKVKVLESGSLRQLGPNYFSFMPLSVIPDHTDFLIRILFHQGS